jgi:hypothetical protein
MASAEYLFIIYIKVCYTILKSNQKFFLSSGYKVLVVNKVTKIWCPWRKIRIAREIFVAFLQNINFNLVWMVKNTMTDEKYVSNIYILTVHCVMHIWQDLIFSKFSCMFLHPNNIFQFEL